MEFVSSGSRQLVFKDWNWYGPVPWSVALLYPKSFFHYMFIQLFLLELRSPYFFCFFLNGWRLEVAKKIGRHWWMYKGNHMEPSECHLIWSQARFALVSKAILYSQLHQTNWNTLIWRDVSWGDVTWSNLIRRATTTTSACNEKCGI